jgi:hypothetical protein
MASRDLSDIAERYVRLVLGVGQHDPDYVDAYYGPSAWRPPAGAPATPLDVLRTEARALSTRLDAPPGDIGGPSDDLEVLRVSYLRSQLGAVDARIRMLQGERFTFDQESRALYDAVAPCHPESYFADTLTALDRRLPGPETMAARLEQFKQAFVIPPDRLDGVFAAAIHECRVRTLAHLALPDGERFTTEYVTAKPWSGYNWYRGRGVSVIQVNTDLPIYIDRAVDLAAHEGYPGHHVYNALLEQHLVRERGWVEFTVYALFSPQSLIAEGTANFGIDVTFLPDERLAFERDVLFPAAGLDAARVEEYYEVAALVDRLGYAGNEAARQYLDGHIDRDRAVEWLQQYALMPQARAEQRVRFFDAYRSYVINYNLGKDLVRAAVERRGGTADNPARRWDEFGRLLSSPRVPSTL